VSKIAPPPCTYTLTPFDLSNRPAAGGAVNISVTTTPGCPVTATSYQSVGDDIGHQSRTGTSTVQLQISANAGPARATSIVVADRLFLVTQLAP